MGASRLPSLRKRAKQFARSMERAAAEGQHLSAALMAVHCGIASADLVCATFLGRTAAPRRREDAAELLARTGAPAARERAEQLRRILDLKHAAAYDDRLISAAESERLVGRARRFHEWAMAVAAVKGDDAKA